MNFYGEQQHAFDVESFVDSILGKSTHVKRMRSICSAVLGVISSGSLIIHRIGRGMADSLELEDKHAIKQVDRLL